MILTHLFLFFFNLLPRFATVSVRDYAPQQASASADEVYSVALQESV